jgi:hypothetical protein
MVGGCSEEDDGGGGMGQKSWAFSFYLGSVKIALPSQPFILKTEQRRKSSPPRVSIMGGMVPLCAGIEETWQFFLTRRAGHAVKQVQKLACAVRHGGPCPMSCLVNVRLSLRRLAKLLDKLMRHP